MPINCGGSGDVIAVATPGSWREQISRVAGGLSTVRLIHELVVQDSYPLDPGAATTRLYGLLHGRLGCLLLIEIQAGRELLDANQADGGGQ